MASLPKMWDTQEKIYVTRELEQYDFNTVQNIPDDPTSAGISKGKRIFCHLQQY